MSDIIVRILLIIIVIGWIITGCLMAYSITELAIFHAGNKDASLDKAETYLWYVSFLTWIPLLIFIIIVVVVLILGAILAIFTGGEALEFMIKPMKWFFGIFINPKKHMGGTFIMWTLLIIFVVISIIVGILCGLSAYYITKTTKTGDYLHYIQKFCYISAFIALIIILAISCYIIYFVYDKYSNFSDKQLDKKLEKVAELQEKSGELEELEESEKSEESVKSSV